MVLGIAKHVWSIGDLLDAALAVAPTEPTETAPDRRRRFRVIEGAGKIKSSTALDKGGCAAHLE